MKERKLNIKVLRKPVANDGSSVKSSKKKKTPSLRRYTNMASLIHILQTKKITLLNPATWDDKNDAYFMAEFKAKSDAATVLALCFTTAVETYHHWRIFANGADGVRIEFDRRKLRSAFSLDSVGSTKKKSDEYVVMGNMRYKLIDDLKARTVLELKEIPFLKRMPFEPESEFRVVYVNLKEATEFKDFPIQISWIKRITLSPWVSDSLKSSIVKTLRSIDGCGKIPISRSTLISNNEWRSLTNKVV